MTAPVRRAAAFRDENLRFIQRRVPAGSVSRRALADRQREHWRRYDWEVGES